MSTNELSSRKYFFAAFAVSCILLLTFTMVVYKQSEISESHNQEVLNSYEILRLTRTVLIQALNVETGKRGYILSRSEKFLEPYLQSINELNKTLAQLDTVSFEEGIQKNVDMLRTAVAEHKRLMVDHLEKFRRTGQIPTTSDLEQSKRAMEGVRKAVADIANFERTRLDARMHTARDQERNYRLVLVAGAGTGICALMVAYFVILALTSRTRQTERYLRESEERFKMVMNGVNDGIFDFDVRHQSFFYSPSLRAMLDYDEQELTGSLDNFKSLVHPDDLKAMLAKLDAYAQGDTPRYVNIFRMKHKDGSWRWIMARGVAIRDEEGNMLRLVGAHTDISEQKKYEEELKQLNDDLEGFTYIASHDLRAPLVNLKGFAAEVKHSLSDIRPAIDQAMQQAPATDQEHYRAVMDKDIPEAIGFITAAVERMDKLTTAIVDMSRIGRREYRITAVDCNQVVNSCIKSLAHEIALDNVKVEVTPLPNVETDALALEQVFGNLIDNAIKYLSPERPGIIKVNARSYSGEVIFNVTDNGRGIADTDMRKVFEIFRRAGNSGDVRGTGMGMAYVKATLRKLGGRIWFDSKLGEGTTFYFSIPKNYKTEKL